MLREIDVSIKNGEQVAIIGRSGCGKSTLLHLMAGLIKPSSGVVRINGKSVVKPSAKWNMMFQKASLFPWMSVVENASLGLVYSGVSRTQAHREVRPLLELLGLLEKSDVNVQNLSGGQQQRVALARSLATAPDALFLDEPFSALDTFSRTSLQQEVASICRDKKISMVLVTHDVDEAVIMADRVLIMAENPGRISCEFDVQIPWPRNIEHAAFMNARNALMRQFQKSSLLKPRVLRDATEVHSTVNAI